MSESKLGRQCWESTVEGLDSKGGEGRGGGARACLKLCKHTRTMQTDSKKQLDKAVLALRISQAHTISHMHNAHISSTASLKQCNVKDERTRYVVPLETIKN